MLACDSVPVAVVCGSSCVCGVSRVYVLGRHSRMWVCDYIVHMVIFSRGNLSTHCNAAGYIDEMVLTPQHMYKHPTCLNADPPCKYFDPEGFLTTFGAIMSVLLGMYGGRIMALYRKPRDKIIHWTVSAVVSGGLAFCCWYMFDIPLNKNLFTPTYSLLNGCFTCILCMLLYVMCVLMRDN